MKLNLSIECKNLFTTTIDLFYLYHMAYAMQLWHKFYNV
jgi:hypothetical protein